MAANLSGFRPVLTILTPTYNRKHTLPTLYDSLLAQTNKNFEWLVIDDGSVDGTSAWVTQQCVAAPFPVRIIQQSNQGKHIALNTGAQQARGEWVFIVDSDDFLTPDAVVSILDVIQHIPSSPWVVGICFRRSNREGNVLGADCTSMPVPWLASPGCAGRLVQADLAYVFRTSAMLAQPFPQISGEKFVPELYIWNRIGDLGQIWFYLQHAIYCGEYLEDGYTRNFFETLKKNPRGFLLFYLDQIKREKRFIDKLKAVIRSAQCCYYAGLKKISSRVN